MSDSHVHKRSHTVRRESIKINRSISARDPQVRDPQGCQSLDLFKHLKKKKKKELGNSQARKQLRS